MTLTPSGFAAQSDVDGSYYLEAPPDAYTATATKTSYVDATASVQLSYVGLPTVQDFALVTAAGDSDGDGFLDGVDNCPSIYNPGQWDYDQDGQGNDCDANDDNDGLTDAQEAAAGTYPLDPDSDNDGSQDGTDAFPLNPNGQLDTDGDGSGDNADPDADNDGVLNGVDTARLDPQVCADVDADLCDDCEIGVDGFGPLPDNDPANDGPDCNADGICDRSDPPLMADGDLNADGAVDAADVLLAHRMLMGQIPADLSRGDVAPLVGGVPASDGIFDLGDVLLIQRKALGQISF